VCALNLTTTPKRGGLKGDPIRVTYFQNFSCFIDIDIEQIQKLAEDPDIQGTILEAESYKKGVRAVISIE
jgi:hypothetical protein